MTNSQFKQNTLRENVYDPQIHKKNYTIMKEIILHKIILKSVNRNVRLLRNNIISMHSLLCRGSLCMNYCIHALQHGGDQPVILLRCS